MQPQLTLDSDSELRARLYAASIFQGFNSYKLLAEWLGVYQYILPANRKFLMVEASITTPYDACKLWKYLAGIETLLTIEEQALAWTLIRESGIYPIPPF